MAVVNTYPARCMGLSCIPKIANTYWIHCQPKVCFSFCTEDKAQFCRWRRGLWSRSPFFQHKRSLCSKLFGSRRRRFFPLVFSEQLVCPSLYMDLGEVDVIVDVGVSVHCHATVGTDLYP